MSKEISWFHKLPYFKDLLPHDIQGIPQGYSFFLNEGKMIDHLMIKGKLLAFKDSNKEKMSWSPVIYPENATQEEIDKEFNRAEKHLIKIYQDL